MGVRSEANRPALARTAALFVTGFVTGMAAALLSPAPAEPDAKRGRP